MIGSRPSLIFRPYRARGQSLKLHLVLTRTKGIGRFELLPIPNQIGHVAGPNVKGGQMSKAPSLCPVLYIFSTPFYKILVPTVDTLRYDFLVHTLILAERPVLMVGPVGTGKTSVAQGVLQRLDPARFNILTVNLSAQVCMCRDTARGLLR